MTDAVHITDDALVELIHQDQLQAFHTLYERYKAAMLVFAAQRVDKVIAEDLVQDVFLGIWKNRNQLTIAEEISGYLFKALRSRIIDHMSRDSHAKKYLDSLDAFSYQFTSADAKIREEHFMQKLEELLTRYGPQYQRILKMRMEGYSNQEIADALGLSEKTIRNQTWSLMKFLRSKLSNALLFLFF